MILVFIFIPRNVFPKQGHCVPEDSLEMRAAGAPEKTVFRGTWFDLGDVVRGVGWGGGVFGWAWGHETLIPRILGTGALCLCW